MRPLRTLRPPTCSAIAFVSAASAVMVGASLLIPSTPAAHGGAEGRFDRPHSGFASSSTMLRDGSPASAGLDAKPIDDALAQIAAWEEPSGTTHPLYAGAVTLLGHNGRVVAREASGYALRYADVAGTELPRDQWVPMREDTIFDLASVTKLFTSILVMQQVERGDIRLEEPVATYLPEFAANGKDGITVRQLLTHTSGLKPWMPLWSDWPDRSSRLAAVLDVVPTSPPGTTYVYSDLNLITLGVLLERQTCWGLDHLVRQRITEPLRMKDTGYNPDPKLFPRIAATEFQASPPRGMVRGEVHDENAWSLGGVAGHAGVFSTAQDLAVLAQSMLNGGTYGGHRILSQDSVAKMTTNLNQPFPDDSHGLGFELDQRWYMGGLSSPTTAGHTGFTGTSIVIDNMSRSFAIVLSNRVHPSRDWGSNNPARRAAVQGLALALGVRPRHGSTAWFSGTTSATTATLTTRTLAIPSRASLAFDLFVDTESTDPMTLESSTDGGATWLPVPFTVRDRGEVTRPVPTSSTASASIATSGTRRWLQARAALSEGRQQLRWRYTTDEKYVGRGVFVDGVRVAGHRGVVLDGERHPEVFFAQGWTAVGR